MLTKQEQIDKAIEFVRFNHNGQLLYKVDPQQYAKLMVWYAEHVNKQFHDALNESKDYVRVANPNLFKELCRLTEK